MRVSSRLMVVAVFVVVAAAACGSSSKGATGSTTSSSGSGTTAPGSGATPTTKALSGNSGSSFCDLARQDSAAFKRTNVAAFTAADMKKEFENLGPALQRAADVAPSEIKGDFETFINAFKPYLKALADANYDFTKVNTSSIQGLSAPQVKAASAHIEQYFSQVCHITTPTT